MSPSPDTHDSNSSSSVVMASPGATQHQVPQQKHPEARGGVVAEQAEENLYLAGLTKKARGLKKKMDKIKRTEALSASGKVRARDTSPCCSETGWGRGEVLVVVWLPHSNFITPCCLSIAEQV